MKRVLFISPDFFDYPKLISNCLKDKGFAVDWMSDRPFSSTLLKGIGRLFPFLFKRKMKHYCKLIAKKMYSNDYEIVLIILGQFFSSESIKMFKKILPKATFILYMWDSFANFPICLEASKEYDFVYTFEFNDAVKYNYRFLPLFYSYKKADSSNKKYFCSFVGTVKKGKLSYLNEIKGKIEEIAKENGGKCYFYFYLQSKLVFIFYKFFSKEFKHSKMSDFHYKKLNYLDNLNIMNQSFIVIDCTMEKQNGLTMRSFEALSQGAKLFTNNLNIEKYDFYNTNNIYIYRGKIDNKSTFFKNGFETNYSFLDKYNISNWIDQLIGGSKIEDCRN